MRQMLRQGDVLAIEITDIPADAKPVKADKRGVVLMEGEATGHHHRFRDDGNVALLERASGERFLTVKQPSKLTHEEHSTILFTGKKFHQVFQVEDHGTEIVPVRD